MTRRLRYHVAVSLDGYIATPEGGYDWLIHDPMIDLMAMWKQFDTLVMGRKTYDLVRSQPGGVEMMKDARCVVFSRTLPASAAPAANWRFVSDDAGGFIHSLKKETGKDIWLFGGGGLFRTLLDAGVVDTVELAVMPVLLGDGIPLLPPGAMTNLTLTDSRVLPKSGIVALTYSLPGAKGEPPRVNFVRDAKPARRKATKRAPKKRARPSRRGKQ